MIYKNNYTAFDLRKSVYGHVDIPRLRKGRVGGFFWSAYVDCPPADAEEKNFMEASWRVRYVSAFLERWLRWLI